MDGEWSVSATLYLADETNRSVPFYRRICKSRRITQYSTFSVRFCEDINWGRLGCEVGILESRFELEAIAERPIGSNMPAPNQSDEESQSDVGPESDGTECKWECVPFVFGLGRRSGKITTHLL